MARDPHDYSARPREDKQRRQRPPLFPCPIPKCASHALLRSSEGISRTMRVLKYQCTNIECGHTWEAHLSFIGTISPSALPQTGQALPMLGAHRVPEPRPPIVAVSP